ncbi:hypothetical protein BABINDRAFT_162374 [Babjeviella inositovora NRRL Y-12698]|uniref:DNA-directed RNA polymerase III subunit RPC5 n=1 Tax=Babjeviella inositovora NRRL Y-12698 TaxID=984486 RepID=A0A1E3QLW0_9ASCO|nr:uncharacterized protein BABINDRAFT_162374 [Babjeviella inositovora NRRL Y-12698]ODQ78671.1 hypothetical protein BABINDRAFT_162374 [Babjeviella inositovora NRRL Y-12698]
MSLFVPEEEEVLEVPVYTQTIEDIQVAEEEEDPVEWEIPVAMNPLPASGPGEEVTFSLLQFPGRPAKRPYNIETESMPLHSRYKEASQSIELEIPMNTGRFYDALKADSWNQVTTQTLGGPFVETDGYYVGVLDQGIMKLIPLHRSAQLRPTFTHIDAKKDAEKAMLKDAMKAENPTKSKEILVQMSVKSASDQQPRLGGCLAATKKFDEEEWEELEWVDESLEQSETVRRVLLRSNDLSKVVESKMSADEYSAMLFSA